MNGGYWVIMGNHTSAITNFFTPHYHHIVMLGLDGAGKTTILNRMAHDQYKNTTPTVGFNCEKVRGTQGKSKGVVVNIWDVGGQDKIRPLWSTYLRHTEGIFFVIDSCDVERMEEAKLELTKIARKSETIGVPIVIIVNKQDLPNTLNCSQIEKQLSVQTLCEGHPYKILSCIAVIGEGIHEAIGCLYDLMPKSKKSKSKSKR